MLGEKNILARAETLLHKTLVHWREWSIVSENAPSKQPQVIAQLTGGLTNQSFLVGRGDFKAVVRINSFDSDSFAIDRDRETLFLNMLQSTGCVPRLLYADSDTQVTQFLEGRCLTDNDLANPSLRAQVEGSLKQIQAIRLGNRPRRNYLEYSRSYSDQLSGFTDLETIERASTTIDEADWQPVISHHDLLFENILCNDQGIYFIDWEYAELGHPLIDYLRVFGPKYCTSKADAGIVEALVVLQHGLTKLWHAVKGNDKSVRDIK
ncbi:MAG TPA: hypothetical protein EYQ44_05505 [Porticoccaceae bacterium]|nr:hypothetical protein [Porticoccaceae bacterium]HIK79539.1 hypothetical protein [Porticoccaceae bacterium]